MRSLEGSGGEGSKARELVRSGEQAVFREEKVGSGKYESPEGEKTLVFPELELVGVTVKPGMPGEK